MGRGRKGMINHCMKKTNSKNNGGIAKVYKRLHKSDEDALDFMKNMNQQELADFLLSDGDWHVKTSGINASGCWFNITREATKAARLFKAVLKSGEIKINLPEHAFEFMKNMNPQQLADILLQDGKTLSASGN